MAPSFYGIDKKLVSLTFYVTNIFEKLESSRLKSIFKHFLQNSECCLLCYFGDY